MDYNPEIHHKRSIRLKDYNYSSEGAYFITICLNNRECFFGNINKKIIDLSEPGKMINSWWLKIPEKFSNVELDFFVIMPNHIHGIILINGKNNPVGVDPRVNPGMCNSHSEVITEEGKHAGLPLQKDNAGLSKIVQWFKTMTTNEYIRNVKQNNWKPFDKKLWQGNYYEHIIRSELSLNSIRKYIVENPLKWDSDKENPVNIKG